MGNTDKKPSRQASDSCLVWSMTYCSFYPPYGGQGPTGLPGSELKIQTEALDGGSVRAKRGKDQLCEATQQSNIHAITQSYFSRPHCVPGPVQGVDIIGIAMNLTDAIFQQRAFILVDGRGAGTLFVM